MLMAFNSPFGNTADLLKPFEMIKNNGKGHGLIIAVTNLSGSGGSGKSILKLHANTGDIEEAGVNTAGTPGCDKLSVYLAQLSLPQSAAMYPLPSDNVQGYTKMRIVLNDKLVVDEMMHPWNVALAATAGVAGNNMRPSELIVLDDGVVRHTWQAVTVDERKKIYAANCSGKAQEVSSSTMSQFGHSVIFSDSPVSIHMYITIETPTS